MRNFLILSFVIFSTTVFGQIKFVNPDSYNLKSLNSTKENHHLILRTYRKQIDSEIKRLLTGVEYEISVKAPKLKIDLYQKLLAQLLIKRIFLTELDKQLEVVDIDAYVRQPQPRRPLLNTEAIKINLEKEIGVHLDSVVKQENFTHYFISDLKNNLFQDTLKLIAKKTYQSVGTGLLTKIITNGMTAGALKSVVLSMGSKIFVSVGTSSLITLVTTPLSAYRLTPENVWTDILHNNPELIINPDWMIYAKGYDDPWTSHAFAILRRTKHMEKAFNSLMIKEESEFLSAVRSIEKSKDFKEQKADIKNEVHVHQPDGTYVHRPIYIVDNLPFWAFR